MELTKIVIVVLFQVAFGSCSCMHPEPRTFHLIRHCQRSRQEFIELENVATLDECFELAARLKALALNFSPLRGVHLNLFEMNQKSRTGTEFPRRSNRRHFFDQPEAYFNCHALQCPESSAFTTMINDSRFDYYSLYGDPPAPKNFVCLPEIGIFQLNKDPMTFSEASLQCNSLANGSLASVVSEARTNGLSKLLRDSNYTSGSLKIAYVGLNFTAAQGRNFQTSAKEDLRCFVYRAWAPGHPKREKFENASCIAVTTENTWISNDCGRRLPYICEVHTSLINASLYEDFCDKL